MAANRPSRTEVAAPMENGEQQTGEGSDNVTNQAPNPVVNDLRSSRRRNTVSRTKLVFSDPVAFRYLEEDENTVVLERWKRLQGYELYIVEQWVCSRTHPTFIICTHTGDPAHSILVNVLAVPNDRSKWSRRLKLYYEAVSKYHAREHETDLGIIMLTNLSGFPSALAVISVPGGDVKKHREDFIVNENLKRMGCAGRAAMNLQKPPLSTIAKFHHLYQTSEAIDFRKSVIELVKVCQTALVLYDKLEPIYTDGLLCDITERAISDWWNDIGTEFHNVEPSDGILGPTTVSALLGLLIGAHNRMKSAGIAVSKDVLDINSMKRSVGHFQKAAKMNKTRRLDRETLDRLHRATAKTASGEGWGVPRAVKSTVAELSGKGGEMVMGIVGGKEKAGISEVETLDIDRLAQLVPGAKMKWLWQGKPLKSAGGGLLNTQSDNDTDREHDQNFLWTEAKQGSTNGQGEGESAGGHYTNEGKIGRLREAVGLKTHGSRLHRREDEVALSEESATDKRADRKSKDQSRPGNVTHENSYASEPSQVLESSYVAKPAFNLALKDEEPQARPQTRPRGNTNRLKPVRRSTESMRPPQPEQVRPATTLQPHSLESRDKKIQKELRSLREEVQSDVYQNFASFDDHGAGAETLRRSRSALTVREMEGQESWLKGLPRRLSFGFVEGLTIHETSWDDPDVLGPATAESMKPLSTQMAAREAEAAELRYLSSKIINLEQVLLPYAEKEMTQVEDLDTTSRNHLSELNGEYYSYLDEYQSLQATSTDLVSREKSLLSDDRRRIEMLEAKLDYELSALQSRIQEVDDGAAEFERSVREIEARVGLLIDEKHGQSSDPRNIPWLRRMVNFMSARK